MIRAIDMMKRTPVTAAHTPLRTAAKSASSLIDTFHTSTAAAKPGKQAANPETSPLGTASVAAKTAQAEPAGLPVAFTAAGVEAHMNQWLVNRLQQENDFRTRQYNLAVEGWKNTNARNRELGLPEVPPPPAPELAEVAPMPPGWWLEAHS